MSGRISGMTWSALSELLNRWTLTLLVLAIAIFQTYFVVFVQRSIDWDIEAFLYLGDQLWRGNLLFEQDFETKLPMVQYFAALPAAMGGVGAWKLFGLSLHAVSIFAFLYSTRDAFGRAVSVRSAATVGLLIYGLATALSGGVSLHLGGIASSFMLLALASLLVAQRPGARQNLSEFFAGVFVSVAVGLRPNFVGVGLLLVLLALFSLKESEKGNHKKNWTGALRVIAGGVVGLVLQVAPYLFSESRRFALVTGAREVFYWSKGISLESLISRQFEPLQIFFFLGLYALSLFFLLSLLSRSQRRDLRFWLTIFSIMSMVLLSASFLASHWWPHYSLMYLFVLLVMFRLLMDYGFYPQLRRLPRDLWWFGFFAASIAITPLLSGVIDNIRVASVTPPILDINKRGVDDELLAFLSDWKSEGGSFVVVEQPAYHRLLGEDRVGDGHPAVLYWLITDIRSNKWEV